MVPNVVYLRKEGQKRVNTAGLGNLMLQFYLTTKSLAQAMHLQESKASIPQATDLQLEVPIQVCANSQSVH
jgi:hypothetical protein